MFEDASPEMIVVPSTWMLEPREMAECKTQTYIMEVASCAIQTTSAITAQTQTDDLSTDSDYDLSVNLVHVALFLEKVESMMSLTLLSNLKSKVFNGYTSNWREEENDNLAIKLFCAIDSLHSDLVCTQVAWSMSGNSVAAS